MIGSFFGIGPNMFLVIFLFSVFLCQQIHAGVEEPTKDEQAYALYQSSKFFSNLEYELEVHIDVTTYHSQIWGSVLITMKCIKETNKMFLDRNLITINDETIKAWKCKEEQEDKEIMVLYGKNVTEDKGYKIKLKSYMKENVTYKVRLEFTRRLYSTRFGLVEASYRRKRHDLRRMIFTIMKEHYAYQVFPCFNEVNMKAKFKVKIGHIQNVKSFTNSKFVASQLVDNPEEWTKYLTKDKVRELKSIYAKNENVEIPKELPKMWVVDEFAQTVSISTFSVALAVVDFDSYEPATLMIGPPNTDLSEVKVLIWAEEDILVDFHLEEVLRVAAQSLAFFSKFFSSTYNAGKLDVIVLPVDEITVEDSYGLIYLGEKMVKYVFTESSHFRPDRYFLVSKICKASSRQWIGHSVSVSKWSEEWFYEGLHTYLRRHCIAELFENWKIPVQLELIDSFISLLRTEERGRTYDPIMQTGIYTYFDKPLNPETKSKVQLVIRMLSFILEVEKKLFQKGLADFIDEFQSRNVDLSQLLNSWTKIANAETEVRVFPRDNRITISRIIQSWLNLRGHPLINVSRNKANNVITVTQRPFTFPDQNELERCWPIPFDIITKSQLTSNGRKMRNWLTCNNSPLEIYLANANKDDWFILSMELHVPGRVHYLEMDSWLLIKNLFHNEAEISAIHNLTRIQLIHDMFTLAEASYLNYDFVFETMKYMSHEKDYGCWQVLYHELNRLRSRWIGTKLFEPFQKLVRTIIQPIFKKKVVTIDEFLSNNRSKNFVRLIIVQIACTFELSNCMEYSKSLLENMMTLADSGVTNPNAKIPELLRECFYCNAMKNADEKTWDFFLEKYKDDQNSEILRALGCSKNTSILKKFLTWSLDRNNPNTSVQVGLKVFEILSSSGEGYQLIMEYFAMHRWNFSNNKKLIALTKFINKSTENIIIDDFLIKVLEATNQQTYLDVLQKFSKTLSNRKAEKVTMEDEAVSIAKRTISWFQEKAGKLSEYFSK